MSIELDSYRTRHLVALFASIFVLPLVAGNAFAQDEGDDEEEIQEIVVVGSQIKGATYGDLLPVSVLTSDDIEVFGIESGNELLHLLPEQGQNFWNEVGNGGIDGCRGDCGAYNLRNLGTGNTLVLLNGRRLVNSAAFQNERIGDSFVPVASVNSQSIPVFGLAQVEVLREGASAIYGADAVAGVINYVTKSDFDGFSIRARYSEYDSLPSSAQTLTFEWGKNFNDGRTNLSVFGNFYNRDRINTQYDPKWAVRDYRFFHPESSPWFGDTDFRGTSSTGEFGQFDVVSSVAALGLTGASSSTNPTPGAIWDSGGEFHVYPAGDAACGDVDAWPIGPNTCGRVDRGSRVRYNFNANHDLYSELRRINVFAFLNHDFDNGTQSFTEVMAYFSDTNAFRSVAGSFSRIDLRVGAQNYYNPFGPCGSPNRLPDSVIGTAVPCEGLELNIDNYRWTAATKRVDNDGDTFRILQGLRGVIGDWDWETALTWSRATKTDITNRVSNTLAQEALNDPTPAAYNPFNGGIDTNIERVMIPVVRDNETELKMFDFKISKIDLFELPAGPMGFLAGVEFRDESYVEDYDANLDGTIPYTNPFSGLTFPIVSDIMGSSPALDRRGSRETTSVFLELQVPLFSTLDIQAAVRYEDFSDISDDATVGKIAFGWRPVKPLLIRGSWSEGFRAPNLITVDPILLVRSNTIDDFVCFHVDPDEDLLDCRYGIVRTAQGGPELRPEKSEHMSFGIVLDVGEHFTFTADVWEIERNDKVGLFGRAIQTGLDLLLLIEAGNSNCASVERNTVVARDDPSTLSAEEIALYDAAGICPVGQATAVNEIYTNLDTNNVRGYDVGVYFDFDTRIGEFDFRYVATFLDEFDQVPSGAAQQLIDGIASGVLPSTISVAGFGSVIEVNGNPRDKHTARLGWHMNDWGASLTGSQVGSFTQTSATLSDGTRWVVDSHTSYNASLDYRFDAFFDSDATIRFGVVNLTDERAPLADDGFGYFDGYYDDLGRSYYLDFRMDF